MAATSPRIEPDHLVLVAFLPSPRDLEIARTLGWYRIPLATAPRTLRVDWLAFYLPKSFGKLKWAVRFVAPVRGYELIERRSLLFTEPDHPRADDPYFMLQLGPVSELDPPVPSRGWRRFTFLYTTGERLLGSPDLSALSLPASARLLRERSLQTLHSGQMSAE